MNRRFALIQALFSLIALSAVVWWALDQKAPQIPHTGRALAYVALAGLLYALATVVRAERWHRILLLTGVEAGRADCYSLTTVGYMGNNVLPARAGEMLRVVLLSGRIRAGKRELLGTVVAERLLDAVVLGTVFMAVVYWVLADRDVLPTDRPVLIAGIGMAALLLGALGVVVLRRRGALARLREFARPLVGAPRAIVGRPAPPLLVATSVLWALEGGVYLAVARAVDLDISTTGALYLVALTNFVAALPAAPGSIGTFDAAVAWGARALGGAGAVVVSYLILLRFVLYVPITVVGLAVLVVRYGGWSRLRGAARLEASRA